MGTVGEASSPTLDDVIEVEIGGAVVRMGKGARTELVVAIIDAL
ncbi:hypothetical protein [Novosphingobium sp. BL-8A]